MLRQTAAIASFLFVTWLIGLAYGTCVLDSDFGFILNCNFKKSSLFRVRNLGGVKAHFGLGFSVGDELGLAESLGNVEGSKRRSLSQRDTDLSGNNNNIGVLPASKMTVHENRPTAVVAWQPSSTAPSFSSRLLQIDQQKLSKIAAMTEAVSLPLGVPAFRPIPSIPRTTQTPSQNSFNRQISLQHQMTNLTYLKSVPETQVMMKKSAVQKIPPQNNQFVPPFQEIPSVSTTENFEKSYHDFLSRNSVYQKNKNNQINNNLDTIRHSIESDQLKLPEIDLMGHTVEELAAIANVSVEAIQHAIRMKQKQLVIEEHSKLYEQQIEMLHRSTTTTISPTIMTTVVPSPTLLLASDKKRLIAGENKVMNAPKEYYPVGYEKNFDDNFISKVDLPSTSFYCGNQKHFPGLYADMDLGCMVFHVCALTDDGLIMKSFLCPESTLFDQTVLKCNWWFYVDCKNSLKLYDSNLPVSKSYQLMKALTFFSNYKNGQKDKSGVKNSVASIKTT